MSGGKSAVKNVVECAVCRAACNATEAESEMSSRLGLT